MPYRIYRFRVTSDIANLDKVRLWGGHIARRLGFDERSVFEIEISLYEACANVIEHAYLNRPDQYIDLTFEARDGRAVLTILDEGGAFDPSQLKTKDIPKIIDTEQDGGLGMFIIEACMDEILYRRHNGRNVLELIKYLPDTTQSAGKGDG